MSNIDWKDIPGWEGLYKISPDGEVISIRSNVILKHTMLNTGYPYVSLCILGKPKKCLVHRLVAQTFLPNPENLAQVNHKDGNRANCNLSNLEWISSRDNHIHAIQSLGRKSGMLNKIGAASKLSKPIISIDEHGNELYHAGIHEASRVLKVSLGLIWRVLKNRQSKTKGFKFKYA